MTAGEPRRWGGAQWCSSGTHLLPAQRQRQPHSVHQVALHHPHLLQQVRQANQHRAGCELAAWQLATHGGGGCAAACSLLALVLGGACIVRQMTGQLGTLQSRGSVSLEAWAAVCDPPPAAWGACALPPVPGSSSCPSADTAPAAPCTWGHGNEHAVTNIMQNVPRHPPYRSGST
jgi:hypothetical protein